LPEGSFLWDNSNLTKLEIIMAQFDNVSVKKKANVYFDGKCVSHTILMPNGTRCTVGVIFPSTLTFNTASPEIMEINLGECKVRLKGETEWKTYRAGDKFVVPGNSSFDIETVEMLDYVCHFE
jgi:hypothetical protein